MSYCQESGNNLNIQVVSKGAIQEVEDFGVYQKEVSESNNNLSNQSQEKECDSSMTIPRQKKQVNQVPIHYSLQSKYLQETELLKVMQFLQIKNMCLEKYLNSGGEADVYLGYILDNNDNKKERVFRIVKAQVKEQIPEIKIEYDRVTAIKDSKNLIQYKGLIEIDDILVFIMKKYDGSLKDRMNSKMDLNQFWEITFELIDGLIELRIHNIIHSDIKPANILMNQGNKCVYSDFGMSLKLKNRQQLIDINKGYTIKYCSPEHTNHQSLSYASDMYSLGLLVLELSKQLEDTKTQKSLEEFIEVNLLQQEPNKRIQLENLIPSLIMKKELNIPFDNLDIFMVKHARQEYEINEINLTKNLFIENKIKLSYILVCAMIIYILRYKQGLITFKSITDVSFQYLQEEQLIYYFIPFAQFDKGFLKHTQIVKCLELSLLIIKSLQPSEEQTKRAYLCELLIGEAYEQANMFQQSINHSQAGLKILLEHFPTKNEKISNAYSLIGRNQCSLNNYEIGIQNIKKSIEFIKLTGNKQKLITQQYHLAERQKDWKGSQSSFQYFKEVVDNWNANFKADKKVIEGILEKVSISFFELGEYIQSFEMEIRWLRQNNQNYENIQRVELNSIYIQKNIHQFNQEEIKICLDKIMSDEIYDLVKKIVLFEFMVYFESKENYQQMFQIFNDFNSINEEIPLNQEIELKLMFVQYYKTMKNQEEVTKLLREAFNLVKESKVPATFYILIEQLYLSSYLIQEDNLKEIALECFRSVEEQSQKIDYQYEDQKEELESEIQAVRNQLKKNQKKKKV